MDSNATVLEQGWVTDKTKQVKCPRAPGVLGLRAVVHNRLIMCQLVCAYSFLVINQQRQEGSYCSRQISSLACNP